MNKSVITSRSNPRIKEIAALKNKPDRFFLIEGFHLVEMAYQAGQLQLVLATADPKLEVDTILTSPEVIAKLATSVHPEPIVGVAKRQESSPNVGSRALVLDRIQDPGNLGTILRCALAFGFLDVYLLPGCCSPYNAKAIAGSQGALFQLRLHSLSGEETLAELSSLGYEVFGTSLAEAVPMETYPFDKEKKIAVILGNEGQGVGPKLLEKTKANLRISIGGIDSVNVGVAAGILLHHIYALAR